MNPWTLRAALAAPLCAALLAGPGPLAAADWVVPSARAPNLATAVAGAAPGDRILVGPGTYHERLVLARSLVLQAAPGAVGARRPVIDGGGTGHVLDVRAPGVVVRGLAVQGSGERLEDSDACIYVHREATGTRLLGNALTDCAFGIWVNGTRAVELADNVIRGRPHPIFSDRGNGINLWEIREGLIHGNDIAQVRDGVYLSVTADSTVANNHMRNLRFGVHYMYSDHNRVHGNVTCDSQVGLALMFSKRLEITGNAAIGNRDHGILFRSILDSRIEANRVEGNNKGFFLNDASFNEIHGNRVVGNAIGVHVTGGSGDNAVTGNVFAGNRTQVRYAWNYPMRWDQDGRGNYWGDYLGWDMDGDTIGDRTYHASGTMDRLVFRYPLLKLLAASPVVALMQSLEARFPVLRPPSVVDAHPLLHMPALRGPAAAAQTAESLCARTLPQAAMAGTDDERPGTNPSTATPTPTPAAKPRKEAT